jgi:hypothetical protein
MRFEADPKQEHVSGNDEGNALGQRKPYRSPDPV